MSQGSTDRSVIDRTTSMTIEGVYVFDRANGGTFVAPSGTAFPASPEAGEWFWRTDLNELYRRDDTNTTWQSFTAGFVVSARTITAGAGLTGGGDLSADRTLDVVANVDGSITVNANDIQVGALATDGQHGARGGGTQHADAVAAGASGFMTGADKTKLNGLPTTPQSAVMVWGDDLIGTTTTARYLEPGYNVSTAPTSPVQFRVPTAGTLRNLRVHSNTVGTGAATLTFTVRLNGVATALTCGYSNTAADGSDLVHSVAVAAGDLIDIRVTKSAGIAASPVDVMASVELAAA